MLFSGDHIMQGSTVVISPPDGDMRAYLESLEQAARARTSPSSRRARRPCWRAAQGGEAAGAHRLAREAKVAAALRRRGEASVEELVPDVYDDVSRDCFPSRCVRDRASRRIGGRGPCLAGIRTR